MRALLVLGLLGLARGQLSANTTMVTETVTPSSTSPSTSGATPAVTVATDESGQFTAIGDAISYAQHNEIPTVTVLAGTYPAVTVSATPSVAVIGESKSDDSSQNKVVVSDEGTALTLSVNVDGITFQNLDFKSTGSDDPAVNIQGSKLAFYACHFVSAGPVGIETGLGVGIIANSYIEAQETAIDGKATLYIFNTDIVLVQDSAIVAYTTGTDLDGTLYNSTIVFDQATVSPKPGEESDWGYLAKAKGFGSVAVYRGSALDGLIADTGVYVDDITQDGSNFYGEYDDTGLGAYPSNKDARSLFVTLLDDSSISQFTLGAVLAGAYPDFATSDTSWIDPTVLDEIAKADGTDPAATGTGSGSSPSSTSSTSPDAPSSSLVVSTDPSDGDYPAAPDSATGTSNADSSGTDGASPTGADLATGTSAASPSGTGTAGHPDSGTKPPTGAVLVSKTSIAGKKIYDTIQSALDALPTSASASSTVFIYPGTYEEQIVVTAPGTVILVGYSEATSDSEKNQVTIQNSKAGDLSSDKFLTSSATVYANGNDLQAININFSNTHNGANDASVAFAVASDKYASLYTCRVIGNRNALVVDGFFFAANSYIEGSQDMISGSGAGYFLNSTISPSDDGSSITADKRASSSTPGGLVFDQSKVTPVGGAGLMSEISLGRPQNSNARVAFIESHLGSCVESKGWEIWSYASPRTDGVLFGEYKNDGPGSDTSQRVSFATQLTDTSVIQFEIANFFDELSWIDFSHVYGKPFSVEPSSPSTSPTSLNGVASSSDPAASTPSNTMTTGTSLVTTTSSEAITDATATSVKMKTNALDSDSAITPAAVIETTTEKKERTIVETYTDADSTETVQKTSTVTSVVTDPSPWATYSRTVTWTTTITSTPQPSVTTFTSTITSGPGQTSTKTGKTTVVTTSVTSTKTKTESVTTTLSCIPARKMKRHLLPPRSVPATRSNATNVTGSTMTTVIFNSLKSGDSTTTTGVHHVKITISSVTSTVTETNTATVAADTAVVTVTENAGDLVTLDPETSTSIVTSLSSTTSTTTVVASVATITNSTTTTAQSTVGPAPSRVILVAVTETFTSTLSLPASTSTETKTTTFTNTPTTTVTSRPTSTKTKTVKTTTTTTTSTVTATSKDATTCTS